MIRLDDDRLEFSFPEVHREARFSVEFQRTLRIPDDGRDHRLPPGLGRFPLHHVDDHRGRVPPAWVRHGGVMLPMHRSEAMWLRFRSPRRYPFAVKVAAGKVNAVTGEDWDDGLHRSPQDYMAVPEQPWIDGWCVEEGTIRQFVAMPLGEGYTAEEQITGEAEHGGVQIVAYPMRAERWEELKRERAQVLEDAALMYEPSASAARAVPDMGLAAGGRMRQEVYDDPHDLADWDTRTRSRCFVHLADALVWRAITGDEPPTTPPTAKEYTEAGLPWFDYYASDLEALGGSERLARVKSVLEKAREEGRSALPENESVEPENVVQLGDERPEGKVREGRF
ncbi:MAG: hypothetical protein ACOC83_06795 [Gemmatimonadota bacterium]